MSFIDRILAQKGRRGELADRIAGKNSQANLSFNRARGAAANVAASTAARAADGGMNAAAANRLASQGEQAAVAQAAQQQAAGRAGEVARAEDELARMREARSNFGRQLLGAGVNYAGALAAKLGIGTPGGGLGTGPGGAPEARPYTVDGLASATRNNPGGSSVFGPLGGVIAPAAQIAGTAMGGPLGGAAAGGFAQQMFGGGGGGGAPGGGRSTDMTPEAFQAAVASGEESFPGRVYREGGTLSPEQWRQLPSLGGQQGQQGQAPAASGGFLQQLLGSAVPGNDQLLAASPQPQQAAPAPAGFMQALMGPPAAPVAPAAPQGVAGQLAAATMPAGGIPPGMTPEQYAEWLRRQNGGL